MRQPHESHEDYVHRLQTTVSSHVIEVYHLQVFEPGVKEPVFHTAFIDLLDAKGVGDKLADQEARSYASRQELMNAEHRDCVKTYTITSDSVKIFRCPVMGWRTML